MRIRLGLSTPALAQFVLALVPLCRDGRFGVGAPLRIWLKTNWRKRVRVEMAHKRNFNYMQTADDIKKR